MSAATYGRVAQHDSAEDGGNHSPVAGREGTKCFWKPVLIVTAITTCVVLLGGLLGPAPTRWMAAYLKEENENLKREIQRSNAQLLNESLKREIQQSNAKLVETLQASNAQLVATPKTEKAEQIVATLKEESEQLRREVQHSNAQLVPALKAEEERIMGYLKEENEKMRKEVQQSNTQLAATLQAKLESHDAQLVATPKAEKDTKEQTHKMKLVKTSHAICDATFNGMGEALAPDNWDRCLERCATMPLCSGFAHARVTRRYWSPESCVFCGTLTGISHSLDFDLYLKEDTALAVPSPPYDMTHRLKMMEGCGELCSYSIQGVPGKYFDEIRKRVDCKGLFANEFSDSVGKIWPPPFQMPAFLENDYTMNGKAEVHSMPYTNRYAGGAAMVSTWTKAMVNDTIEKAKQGTLVGNYGNPTVVRIYKLVRKHAALFEGKHILVVGSENPWLEGTLLAAGVGKVTTLEYGKIDSQHHQIDTMLPPDLRKQFLESGGQTPRFDGVVSFSSVEHSGLGRYGDILNPWGDIQAVAKAWCVTRPDGPMLLGFPTAKKDAIFWTAHRIYGPIRYANLVSNWKQLDFDGSKPMNESDPHEGLQPVFLFQRAAAPE